MVSVIIPCYNCEGFINRAINSVLAQRLVVSEIILVENNSTDNTLSILKDIEAQYPHLVRVFHEKKKGAPAARNTGLKEAMGEWIQFLDADDEILPDKLSSQLKIANEANADIVAGECLLQYNDGQTKIVRHTDTNIWKGLITSNLGITSSNLWRKSALTAVRGWDENIHSSQEYDLLFRLLKNNAKVAVDKVVNTIVHFSSNSISKSSDKEKLKSIIENRINLRLRIKNELRYKNLLTATLHNAIDFYIYKEIMTNYKNFPEYANSLLQRHPLKVGTIEKMKLRTRLYISQLKQNT